MSQSYAPFGSAQFGETVFGAPPLVFTAPPYEPFGRAIFGETVFGQPPATVFNLAITINPVAYNGLQLNWVPPSTANGQVLVRSSFGTPTTVYDGTVLISEIQSDPPTGPLSASYLDQPLISGHFFYYALFVLVSE